MVRHGLAIFGRITTLINLWKKKRKDIGKQKPRLVSGVLF